MARSSKKLHDSNLSSALGSPASTMASATGLPPASRTVPRTVQAVTSMVGEGTTSRSVDGTAEATSLRPWAVAGDLSSEEDGGMEVTVLVALEVLASLLR